MKPTPLCRRRIGVRPLPMALGVYWLGIFTLTHVPLPPPPPGAPSDKTIHVLLYLFLALLLYAMLAARPIRRPALWTLTLCGLYAVVDELLQIPVGRVADVHDGLADLAGALCGLLLAIGVRALMRRGRTGSTARSAAPSRADADR